MAQHLIQQIEDQDGIDVARTEHQRQSALRPASLVLTRGLGGLKLDLNPHARHQQAFHEVIGVGLHAGAPAGALAQRQAIKRALALEHLGVEPHGAQRNRHAGNPLLACQLGLRPHSFGPACRLHPIVSRGMELLSASADQARTLRIVERRPSLSSVGHCFDDLGRLHHPC